MAPARLNPAFAPSVALPLAARTPALSARRARPIRVAPVCVASEPTLTPSSADGAAHITTNLPVGDGDATDGDGTPALSAFQSLADVEQLTQLATEFDLRDLRIAHEGIEVNITRPGGFGFDAEGKLADPQRAAAAAPAPPAVMSPYPFVGAPGQLADASEPDYGDDDDEFADEEDGEAAAAADSPAAAADQADAKPPADPDAVLDSDFVVTSNRVGFFLSGARNKPPLVTVGDRVKFNQPVCIIEQLGQQYVYLSEAAGTIFKVFIEDGEAVEFGTDIMVIRPD